MNRQNTKMSCSFKDNEVSVYKCPVCKGNVCLRHIMYHPEKGINVCSNCFFYTTRKEERIDIETLAMICSQQYEFNLLN